MIAQSKMLFKVAIASVAAASVAAIVYYHLTRPMKENHLSFDNGNRRRAADCEERIISSKQSIAEVPVPLSLIGGLIGRHSSNIIRIQEETNTKIKFKISAKNEEVRIAIIRGEQTNVSLAEFEIRKYLADQVSHVTYEMDIPSSACEVIFGKDGSLIPTINETCNAKVQVERTASYLGTTKVTIKGNEEHINSAKMLIMELVYKNNRTQTIRSSKPQLSTSTRQYELTTGNLLSLTINNDDEGYPLGIDGCQKTEELVATAQDGFIDVFISAVVSPSHFWVQIIGTRATELDKLDEQMAEFYKDIVNSKDYFIVDGQVKIGDTVAALFGSDEDWYRAQIIDVMYDEYDPSSSTVTIYYVDYGEQSTINMSRLRLLKHEFLVRLPFQAIKCTLANASPSGGANAEWSAEATEEFERLTYSAQWMKIMVKVEGRMADGAYQITMIDTHGGKDLDVCEMLASRGLAIDARQTGNDHV